MKAKDEFKYVYAPGLREELVVFFRYVVMPVATCAMFAVWLWILCVLLDVSIVEMLRSK